MCARIRTHSAAGGTDCMDVPLQIFWFGECGWYPDWAEHGGGVVSRYIATPSKEWPSDTVPSGGLEVPRPGDGRENCVVGKCDDGTLKAIGMGATRDAPREILQKQQW